TIAWRPGGAGGEGPGSGAGVVPGANGIPRGGRGPVGLRRFGLLRPPAPLGGVAPPALGPPAARPAPPAGGPHARPAADRARSALLLAGLTSDPSVLFDATEDFLHQRYRAAVMPETAELLGRLRRAGIAAVVSGAGPSVLALGPADAQPGLAAVGSIARETGIAWLVTPLKVDPQGATVPSGGMAVPALGPSRKGRSTNQALGPGVHPAERSTQGRATKPATHGPQSRECRGHLWC